VMYVCTDAPPPLLDEFYLGESVGLQTYWRGTTYDTFDGRSWSNGASITEEVAPYGPILTLEVTGTIELEQRYRIEAHHGDTLYAVGEPYQVDRPVRSVRRSVDDLIALQGTESEYAVQSRVPRPTTTQLEISPKTYQDQIVDRYLELSPGLPDRVRDLAARVSAGANTAYAKAVAIERYLRQFPYDLNVPSPPSGRDVVDYFLFDAQRGYCDYYASAFVVLARVSGVPSRLAVGYAMGDYDPDSGCYVVTEMDAHSWPEAFFPDYGWVSFEPTAAFRPFDLPREAASSSQVTAHVPAVPDRPWYVALREWARRSQRGWTTYVLGGAVAGALALIAVWARSWHRRHRLSPQQRVALYYRGLTRAGRRFGTVRRSYHTPAEYQSMLLRALSSRVPRYPWVTQRVGAILGQVRAQVLELTEAYELASYSTHPPDGFVTERSERRWGRLGLGLWWLWFASRLEKA
jgi:transglutaminase-like putative cysteine protease